MNVYKKIQNHPNPALLILRGVRLILSDPKRWTKGSLARTSRGKEVTEVSPSASCFCLEGALFRAEHELKLSNIDRVSARSIIQSVLPKPFGMSIWLFNDSKRTSHKRLLKVIDLAIKEAA
ncbi:hypothetical protein IZ6_25390 [Terrihabitans soli]|uniref:Uncharacterized protein n=1 Tax=Terrihabitans soli TaxID=708113 RepID=A0A6S6QMT6_9HYPH|nr:hypothetical protein IZ6_25390 [Terrihabitans soli]